MNLLSGRPRPDPFPELDKRAWVALQGRLGRCVAFRQDGLRASFQARAEILAGELDELESAPSLVSASSLLNAIDQMRSEVLADASGHASDNMRALDTPSEAWAGSLLCYFPGRSLSTGEAEVASRGYFDVFDRPPLWNWVSVVGRRVGRAAEDFEVGILAWVAAEDAARALDGCDVSAAPSVAAIEKASESIAAQWRRAGNQDGERS